MAQLNVHVTPDFEDALRRFMRVRGITSKSEAVRVAVKEGLERAYTQDRQADFTAWIGLACSGSENPEPRFRSDDDLWS